MAGFAQLPAAPMNSGQQNQGRQGPYWLPTSHFYGGRQPYRDSWDVQRAVNYGFNRSIWVQKCIQAISGNQSKLPIVVRQDDWDIGDIVKKHQALPLLNYKSSPYEYASILRKRISQVLLLNRQGAFVEVVRSNNGDPVAFYLLPPGYTWPIPDARTFVRGYMVQYPALGYVELPADQVIWIRDPHPTDPYAGITPLEAAGLSVDIDWYARMWNRNFMSNDMRPAGLVNAKNIGDDEAAEILRVINGSAANRIGVLDVEDMQYVDLSSSPRDSQYHESRAETKEDILLAFGCPESVLGNASGRTFANADAELESFWRETMLPHLSLIARPFDDAVDGKTDHFVGFDFSRVPVLDRDKRERADFALRELAQNAIAVDEYREATGRDRVGASKLYSSPLLTPVADVDRPYEDVTQPPVAPQMPNFDQFGADQFGNGQDQGSFQPDQPALGPGQDPNQPPPPDQSAPGAPTPDQGAPQQAQLPAGVIQLKQRPRPAYRRPETFAVRVREVRSAEAPLEEVTDLWSQTTSG